MDRTKEHMDAWSGMTVKRSWRTHRPKLKPNISPELVRLILQDKIILEEVAGTQSVEEKPHVTYRTSVGEVGMTISQRKSADRGIHEEILLDCSRSETLQGKRGMKLRTIQVRRTGIGSQIVGPDLKLSVVLVNRRPKA